MRHYRKYEILKQHPELAEEVLNTFSLEIFVYLDILLFTVFLGLFLYPQSDSFWPAFIVPFVFFTVFTVLFRFLFREK